LYRTGNFSSHCVDCSDKNKVIFPIVFALLFANFVSMKEVMLNWRGRDILVRYECINYGGTEFAKVLDKNGASRYLYLRHEEGRPLWRDGGSDRWPDDLIEVL